MLTACLQPGCEKPGTVMGRCRPHYKREWERKQRTVAAPCSVPGCARPIEKKTWCGTHYRRWFVHGDASVTKKRPNGAGFLASGYVGTQIRGQKTFEHVRIAEKALGKTLPPEAVVHHANRNRADNRNENLVICPNRAYHNLIHARMDAMDACGNPDWRKCRYCKKYDALENLCTYQTRAGTYQYWHETRRGQCQTSSEVR